MIVETWGTSASKATYKTLTYKSASNVIEVDLSSLGSGTTIYRATLHPGVSGFLYGNDNAAWLEKGVYPITSPHSTGTPQYDANTAQKLIPPVYRSFDITALVRSWVSNNSNHGLYLKDWGFDQSFNIISSQIRIEIAYDGTVSNPPQQVTGIAGFFRSGQAFITWDEKQDFAGRDNPTRNQLESAFAGMDNSQEIRYHLYKHTSAINSSNIQDAQFVKTIKPLSVWNRAHYIYYCEFCPGNEKDLDTLIRFSVDGNGTPLSRTKGLHVHTAQTAGTYYYTVVLGTDGKQNTADFSSANAFGPINETVAEYTEPVLQYEKTGQTITCEWCAPSTVVQHYCHWLSASITNQLDGPYIQLGNQACKASYGLFDVAWDRNGLSQNPGITIMGTSYGERGDRYNGVPGPGNGLLMRVSEQMALQTFNGFHECMGTLRDWDNGKVYNYDRYRILDNIKWLQKEYDIDTNRIYLEGDQATWGLEFPDKFAAISSMGPAFMGCQSDHYTSYVSNWVAPMMWGKREKRATVGNTGVSVWQYNDASYQMQTWNDLPYFSILPGPGHDWKGDGDRGWCAEPRVFWNAETFKHGITLAWRSTTGCGCGEGLESTTADVCWWCRITPSTDMPVRAKNEPYVAFTNNSANKDIGDTAWVQGVGLGGDSCGVINMHVTYDASSFTETADRCEVIVYAHNRDPGFCPYNDITSTADITPRRLQTFTLEPWEVAKWYVLNEPGMMVLDSGWAQANQNSVITVEGVTLLENIKKMVRIVSTDSIGPTGNTVHGATEVERPLFPDRYSLDAAPNPFSTRVDLVVSGLWLVGSKIRAEVYDISGRKIANLKPLTTNNYQLTTGYRWHPKNQPNGIYLVKVRSGNKIFKKKITLVR
jgi:hypothetical protein